MKEAAQAKRTNFGTQLAASTVALLSTIVIASTSIVLLIFLADETGSSIDAKMVVLAVLKMSMWVGVPIFPILFAVNFVICYISELSAASERERASIIAALFIVVSLIIFLFIYHDRDSVWLSQSGLIFTAIMVVPFTIICGLNLYLALRWLNPIQNQTED